MKRLVSLLAIALVSSLFAAGCGKLVNCGDAKKKEECVKEKFEEGAFTCEWKKADAAATAETCVDTWEAKAEAKALCEVVNALPGDEKEKQSACDKAGLEASKLDATATCKFSGEAGKKTCGVAKNTKK